MTGRPPTYVDEFERVRSEWAMIQAAPDPVSDWGTALDSMAAEVAGLRASGLWRSGRKTLLGALGLHHDEVIMCRGLAWLLTSDAWHGLGSTVLDRLLMSLELDTQGSTDAVVVVEEVREDTRADIVVRFASATVLIEAKIWAGEQPRQCDRLAHHWADDAPTLVFLTRTGNEPVTAVESIGQWRPVAWSDIADLIDAAIAVRDDVDLGVLEYLRTLRIHGGNRV